MEKGESFGQGGLTAKLATTFFCRPLFILPHTLIRPAFLGHSLRPDTYNSSPLFRLYRALIAEILKI